VVDGGNVRCWGGGLHGRLGYGNTDNLGDGPSEMPPADVNVGATVLQVVVGNYHTCALIDGGHVRCWGQGANGRLGNLDTDDVGDDTDDMPPSNVDLGGTAVAIAAGDDHTCALLVTGVVRCWGAGAEGALGYGSLEDVGDDETPASAGDVTIW
jgi:alpha-tubulin suppressor-like RCC1 family protein